MVKFYIWILQSDIGYLKKLKLNLEENIYDNKDFTDEPEEPNSYSSSPSVTEQKTINGKTYIVRRYFAGNKDFAKTFEQLAIRQANNNAR